MVKLKCKVLFDDGDVIMRLRHDKLNIDIELRIREGDYITRNDIVPADPIMGVTSTSMFSELNWIMDEVSKEQSQALSTAYDNLKMMNDILSNYTPQEINEALKRMRENKNA